VGGISQPELVILALMFLSESGSPYIQNPHLKAKLAEMLYWGTLKHQRFPYGSFGEVLNSNSFALEWTFPSVMSFYIGSRPCCNADCRGGENGTAYPIL
jgi:ubiquitin conjugation factor E4 B